MYCVIVVQHSHVFDMKDDWKLMTVLVGANDVCLGLVNNIESRSDSNLLGSSNVNFVICSCSGDVPTITADDFENNMRETLEEVRKNIPKLFVNLVLLGNLSEV